METLGWFRKIAVLGIARPANRLGIHRAQVTMLRLIVGVLAAGCMAMGPDWFTPAAAVFFVGFMLAHADAGLADRSGNKAPTDDRYGFYTEVFCNSLAFIGLGIGFQLSGAALKSTELGFPPPVIMGLIAAFAVGIVPWLAKRLEVIDGRRSPEFEGMSGFDGDDITVLVPIALLVGWAEGLLVLAACGGIAFAGGLYMAHFRKYHSLT